MHLLSRGKPKIRGTSAPMAGCLGAGASLDDAGGTSARAWHPESAGPPATKTPHERRESLIRELCAAEPGFSHLASANSSSASSRCVLHDLAILLALFARFVTTRSAVATDDCVSHFATREELISSIQLIRCHGNCGSMLQSGVGGGIVLSPPPSPGSVLNCCLSSLALGAVIASYVCFEGRAGP